MRDILQWVLLATGLLMAAGTALSLSRSPHWFVRGWDFPRVQVAAIAGLAGVAYYALFFRGEAWEWAFLAAAALTVAWQCVKIRSFTPLARMQVKRAGPESVRGREDATLRLLISNVQMENREHERFLRAVREHEPDVVLALETDAAWVRALEPLARTHPHTVLQPQENYYGLALFSRLPLVDPRVRFVVQDDIPSVHTGITLRSGGRMMLHGLHPRPPEPVRDQDSTPRDAELVLVGREIGEGDRVPTVVAGDLNDVAWSPTTELFLRLSGLLDPRVGRGMFNSYNAHNPLFRFPLDHVFHSGDFQLVELRRLEEVGSDHFPILVHLLHAPEARPEQPPTPQESGDQEDAEDRIEKEMEAARTGDDRPSRE
jgi:endonuclease/exonuclease/phosphatase (EEP) superfamily protein YafD